MTPGTQIEANIKEISRIWQETADLLNNRKVGTITVDPELIRGCVVSTGLGIAHLFPTYEGGEELPYDQGIKDLLHEMFKDGQGVWVTAEPLTVE